jgi:transposase
MPTVNVDAFRLALKEFARAVGAGPHKKVLILLDGAGWHHARDLEIPDGIHFSFLPPYSPELQPVERLWPLVHEATANRPFKSLDELEDVVIDRCMKLSKEPQQLRGQTLFHWWQEIASNA